MYGKKIFGDLLGVKYLFKHLKSVEIFKKFFIISPY